MTSSRTSAYSKWEGASELLQVVLPQYLDHVALLKARLVCRSWRSIFGTQVLQLELTQPASTDTAKALGGQAAAAFSQASILRVGLRHGSIPAAAVALLRPLRKLLSLQELQVQYGGDVCRCLPAALPLLPQLQVLDLTGCFHRSCDLLVVARYLKQLRQLLLNCPDFVTLSGKAVGSSRGSAWDRVGGVVRYQPQHMAALAQLPLLRVLECTVPTVCTTKHQTNWLAAVATLTQLTALHLIQGQNAAWPLPAGQLSRLSSLTRLCNLSSDAGAPKAVCWADRGRDGEAEQQAQLQAKQWAIALAGMQQLTRLELVHVLLCDALLLTIGSAAPQLRELYLNLGNKDFAAATSAEGAAAVAHMPHIELIWNKGLQCSHNKAFLQLANIRRLQSRYAQAFMPSEYRGVQQWTAETCECSDCWFERWHRHLRHFS